MKTSENININTKKKFVLSTMLLVLLLLLVTIGYAYLSTTLSINGASQISNASWDVHFEDVEVASGSVVAPDPYIDNDGTVVNYNVTLLQPGEYFEFTVDVVNAGSVDAMIDTITSTLNNSNITTLPTYLNYTVTYENGTPIQTKQELKANTTQVFKVRIEYKKDISAADMPTTEQNLSLSFNVSYVQADETAVHVNG